MAILADSGYWIALLDRNDRYHERALKASAKLNEQLVVTWPVLTEAAYYLATRLGAQAAQRLMELGERGAFHIYPIGEPHIPQLRALMEKYADLPMDLADASLVLLAEQSGDGRILSTDQRDFHAYRFKQHKPFRNLLLE